MNRSELNEKAKKHLDNAGIGTGTNITLHGAKCLMVDFYLDNQVKNNVDLGNVIKCPYCNSKNTVTNNLDSIKYCKACKENF